LRAPENALRLATIRAVFRGSWKVEVDDLEWAIAISRESMRHLRRGLEKHQTEELGQFEIVERIRDQFRAVRPRGDRQEYAGKRVLTWGQIRKACERITSDYSKIERAIEHLRLCGDIAELEPARSAGQPTKRWEWLHEHSEKE
jgi:hypothetical protein